MKVFTGLMQSSFTVRLMYLRKYHDLKLLDSTYINAITDIAKLQNDLDKVHKEVVNRILAQKCTLRRFTTIEPI